MSIFPLASLRTVIAGITTLLSLCAASAEEPTTVATEATPTMVEMKTSLGTITLSLNAEKAPVTVENFLEYVRSGFYDGTIFHRVIGNFMIQGGGFTTDFEQKPTREPIRNEGDNGLSNERGAIAMARTNDPHSATAQFFINVVDNDFLDHTGKSARGWGYTVFGEVVDGMDVVDAIRSTPTGQGGPFPTDVPQTQIVIETMRVAGDDAAE